MFDEQSVPGPGAGKPRLSHWAVLSLLNLLIVSFLGSVLRYKGAFAMPFLDYGNLLHAHSHFAFSGWVTTALYTALLYLLQDSGIPLAPAYRRIFLLNQLASFGMLGSFTVQGYGPVSIFFSSLSVLASYAFAFRYWRDTRHNALSPLVTACARLALVFLVLSSAGPYLLSYSMAHHSDNREFYYNAIYLYLHFQYNGWFSFAVIALFLHALRQSGITVPRRAGAGFVIVMALACIPAYCLSLLWTDPPAWIRVTATAAAVLQLLALSILIITVWNKRREGRRLSPGTRVLWGLALFSFAVKIVLQFLSNIPALGLVAFGFRPIIIAYLHLVLLGFVSFFLIGFFLSTGLLRLTGLSRFARRSFSPGLVCFVAGVIANEVFLLLQSLLALAHHPWASAPYYLLGAALLMFAGLASFLLSPSIRSMLYRHTGPANKDTSEATPKNYPGG